MDLQNGISLHLICQAFKLDAIMTNKEGTTVELNGTKMPLLDAVSLATKKINERFWQALRDGNNKHTYSILEAKFFYDDGAITMTVNDVPTECAIDLKQYMLMWVSSEQFNQ